MHVSEVTEFDVDVVVGMPEYELLLKRAVRQALASTDPIPVVNIVQRRAKILGSATRTDLAREIIEASSQVESPEYRAAWVRVLRSLELRP